MLTRSPEVKIVIRRPLGGDDKGSNVAVFGVSVVKIGCFAGNGCEV